MKKFSNVSAIALMSVLSFCGGCDKRPKGVLSDSQMESLMTDLLLAEAYGKSPEASNLPDSVRSRLGEAVLKEHGVDQATLDSTYLWYSRNLDDYYRLYSRVDRKLQKMRKKVGGSVSNEIENDIWTLPKHLMLSPTAYGNSLTFTLPGDVLAGGEQLRWRMRTNGTSSLDVLLGVDYEDGTSSIIRREFQGGKIDLSLIADTAHKARRVFGFVSSAKRDLPIWADSISLAKNPYDSTTYSTVSTQRRLTPPAKVVKQKPDTLKSTLPPAAELNKGVAKGVENQEKSNQQIMHPVKMQSSSAGSVPRPGAGSQPAHRPQSGTSPTKRPATLGDR